MSTKLKLFDYGFLDIEVKSLTMIRDSMQDDIKSYLFMMDDEESDSVEALKELVLDLLVAYNRNTIQLNRSIDSINKLNRTQLSSLHGKKIKPDFDIEFKRQYAGWYW